MAADPRARAEHILGALTLSALERQGLRVVDVSGEGADPRHVAALLAAVELAGQVRDAQRRCVDAVAKGPEPASIALDAARRLESRLDRALLDLDALLPKVPR